MPIRITGLNSGLDTESIISALVSSYIVTRRASIKKHRQNYHGSRRHGVP